jgi:trehalose 6-phosphate synthase
MSLDERINRHDALLQRIRKFDVHWWSSTFLQALEDCGPQEVAASGMRRISG